MGRGGVGGGGVSIFLGCTSELGSVPSSSCSSSLRGGCQSPSEAGLALSVPGVAVALPLWCWPLILDQARQRPAKPGATQHCCGQITVPERKSHLGSPGMSL